MTIFDYARLVASGEYHRWQLQAANGHLKDPMPSGRFTGRETARMNRLIFMELINRAKSERELLDALGDADVAEPSE